MGLLGAAFLQGAGQGLNVLGQGMLKGIEREDEQEMWEKRTKLLAAIQRENAKGIREDDAAFADSRFPVRLEQEAKTVEARGKATTEAELARRTDSRVIAVESAEQERKRDYAKQQYLMLKNDPDVAAADVAAAKRAADQAEAEYKAMTPLVADRAARSADASAAAAAKYREAKPTIAGKVAEIESVVGRTLTKQELEGVTGIGKTDNGLEKWIRGLVDEDIKAGNITADKAPERLQQIKNGFRALDQDAAIGSAVAQARKDGKAPEAAAELREKGFSDEMLSKWFTKDELKKDEKPKIGGMLGRRNAPLGTMFDHTASKIATDSYVSRTQGR